MTLKKALELKCGDTICVKGKSWEVVDIFRDEDETMISGTADDSYEVFDYREID